jgi:hypothetical protein
VPIITFTYEALAFDGNTLYPISAELDKRYASPGKFKGWAIPFLWSLACNPVYKGKFAAYCKRVVIIERTNPVTGVVKKIRKNVERPESESDWRTANKVMIKNCQAAKRNAKHDYLLSELIWRDVCGRV